MISQPNYTGAEQVSQEWQFPLTRKTLGGILGELGKTPINRLIPLKSASLQHFTVSFKCGLFSFKIFYVKCFMYNFCFTVTLFLYFISSYLYKSLALSCLTGKTCLCVYSAAVSIWRVTRFSFSTVDWKLNNDHVGKVLTFQLWGCFWVGVFTWTTLDKRTTAAVQSSGRTITGLGFLHSSHHVYINTHKL